MQVKIVQFGASGSAEGAAVPSLVFLEAGAGNCGLDALDALDAVGESNVQLVRQVGSDQWDDATPCTEWNVRSLVGHLIMGRHVYRGFLEGVPVAELRLILQ